MPRAHPRALYGLAANPALPPDLVDRLIDVADAELGGVLADRPDLTHTQAVALADRVEEAAVPLACAGRLTAADVDPVARPHAALALLDAGSGDPEWARRFVADPAVDHRERLGACPGLPPDVTEALAADPDVRVVAELALWATPDLAARLARHPHTEVRSAVAHNEATPPEVLAMLLAGVGLPAARRCLVCDQKETPSVHDAHGRRPHGEPLPGDACDGSHQSAVLRLRARALGNPATPTASVTGYAGHPSVLLRRQLATRRDLPPGVGERLAADPAPGVRGDLAENPAIGEALMRVLARDRDPGVRRSLALNPRVPLDVLTGLARTTRIGSILLPRIAAASPAEVEERAASPEPAVRTLLAERRDMPAGVRDALALDPDAKVVKAVAPHPGLTGARLRAMVDDHGSRTAARVAANPDAPAALLEDLVLREPPVRGVFREVARHRNAGARALLACLVDERARPVAAGHPALPVAALRELLADDEDVAEAAAANPSLPPALMRALLSRANQAAA
ncbi:hypothetical protein EIZ62_27315 [Streptomyces ficellus]|uniref:Leucine rich repeat variant n=1 Tax=Streptomyces ficellus TaxID=1977088 RepID=A0A6I6FXT5_9ACTN|nr:hypothetical protein EIZ62_27315 [Streptomyces ficellus]